MIKQYDSDCNLQLRFLISLRSSEGDRKYHEFLFLFFLTRNKRYGNIAQCYDLTNEITIYFLVLAKEPQIN